MAKLALFVGTLCVIGLTGIVLCGYAINKISNDIIDYYKSNY